MDEDVAMDDDTKPKKADDDLEKYNLDDYDEDDTMPGAFSFRIMFPKYSDCPAAMGPFSNIKGLTYYRNNDEDPYITLKEVSASFAALRMFLTYHRTMSKKSDKSSRFYPPTTSLSLPKLKTKSLSWRSTSTTNRRRTSTSTTTSCSLPSLCALNGSTSLPSPLLPQEGPPIPPLSSSETTSPSARWSPKLRSGR